MFDRFTDRAKKVMSLARIAALELGHDCIDPGHVLIGIAKEGTGVAANVLKDREVDLATIPDEVARRMRAGKQPIAMDHLPFTPDAKRVLEFALEEAADLGHNYIGTEHLLLGLLRLDTGVAAQVLRQLGVQLDRAREDVLDFLGDHRAGEATDEGQLPRHVLAMALHRLRTRVRGRAFVALPRQAAHDGLYRDVILPALQDAGFEQVLTSNDDHVTAPTSTQWMLQIQQAEVVVVVLTGTDARAGYLVGLCHGMANPPVVLADRSEALAAQWPWLPMLEYEPGDDGHARLREELTTRLTQRRTGHGDAT